jgi:outer membrane immunogenic protein
MGRWALTLFLLLTGSTAAISADLPVKPLPVAVPWTFYVGGHGGFGDGNQQWYDIYPVLDFVQDADTNTTGGLFGIQIGYNYQLDWLVLGIGGDFSWTNMDSNFNCFTFGDQVCTSNVDWIASITGRLGFAAGPLLFYIKGGPAWMHESLTNLATCSGSQATSAGGVPALCGTMFYGDDTRFGWTIGPGVEWAFAPNWGAFVEYAYFDFGSKSVGFSDGAGNFFPEQISDKNLSIVRAGINYHFNWGSAAIKSYASADQNAWDASAQTHVIGFTGADVGKQTFSAWIGGLIAPVLGFDYSGFRAYLVGLGGTYKYPVTNGSINGYYVSGDALVGYGFEGDNYSINLLIGANGINHTLSAPDPTNPVQGTEIGVKVRADAWINPTPATLTSGEGEYSTAFNTYYVNGKLGFDVTNGSQIFVGPEAGVFGDEFSNTWRVGAHVTQMKFGRAQMDISGGYADDSVIGRGAYGHVELSWNF